MKINIGDISVSIPNGISDWVHQSDEDGSNTLINLIKEMNNK